MFNDIDPEEMNKLDTNWQHSHNIDKYKWELPDGLFLPATMLDKEHFEYDLKKLDNRLKEAIEGFCEWRKDGNETFLMLGRMYLRMGLDISVVIEDLKTLFTAVAQEYTE